MKKIVYLNVRELYPHPDNPRKDLGDLTELSGSIKAKGVLQNLTVVPGHTQTNEEWTALSKEYEENPSEELRQQMNNRKRTDGYTVIIGHRRLAAAKEAGLEELPCVISDMTPQEQFDTMMVENMQRSDLTVYEQARGFQIMLDMGGTIETVSKKTGFSSSTIRNRVKLLDLDQSKFLKAESRGATLQDYIQLNSLSDTKSKNTVLDAIGTPNFANALKKAKDEEEYQKRIKEILETLEASDWCQPLPETDEVYKNYSYVMNFTRWNKNKVTRPENADKVEYFYKADSFGDVTVYQKRVNAENNEENHRLKKVQDEAERISGELREISDRHFEMRSDFVRDFTKFKAHQECIDAFVAGFIFESLGSRLYLSVDEDVIEETTGLKIVDEESDEFCRDGLETLVSENPQKALLCAIYSTMDSERMSWYENKWNVTVQCWLPTHKEKERFNKLYEFLCQLGYEMADEEIAMRDGTHPLFQELQNIVEAYEAEKKEEKEE